MVRRSNPRRDWLLSHVEGTRILDVGCGRHGELHRAYQERGEVVGIDISAASHPPIVGDAQYLPFPDGLFDAVVCGEVLEHVWDGYAMLSELVRVLPPRGRLYLTTPNPFRLFHLIRWWLLRLDVGQFLADPDHKLLWTPHSLIRALTGLGMEIVELTTLGIRVPWTQINLPSTWLINRLGNSICLVATKRGPN